MLGCVLAIVPSTSCSHPLTSRTVEPLVDVMTMSPRPPDPPLPTVTTIALLLALATVLTTPFITTLTMSLALPSSPLPRKVTTVPTCPEPGSTAEMAPGTSYWNELLCVTVAPLSAMTTTSPTLVALLAPAITTICVLLSLTMADASTPAKLTDCVRLPPPYNRSPLIVTRALTCAIPGTTLLITAGVTYCHCPPGSVARAVPSTRSTREPVSLVHWMSPLVATLLAATRTTSLSLNRWILATDTLAKNALTSRLPYPSKLVPVTVTIVPALPDMGLTLWIFPGGLYVHRFSPLTRCCVLESMATSPVVSVSTKNARATTTISLALAEIIDCTLCCASRTWPTPLPPPNSATPRMVTTVPR